LKDAESIVRVRLSRVAGVTEKEILAAMAEAYVASASIEAPIVQVPVALKFTTPESTIPQTPGVELEKCLAPVPIEGALVSVGGVSVNW
jgi:hypothetical protein